MGYIIKKGEAVAGLATVAAQNDQIGQLSVSGSGIPSVFKDATLNSVFQDPLNSNSLFDKSIRNYPLGGTPMLCVSFTAATAAATAVLLNTFLSNNACYVVSLTSSQSIGSHDLFLLYGQI